MPTRARETGPTGARVAGNVRAIRRSRGLDLADVASRLSQLGQPVSVDGLSKIELGTRRVDVDDLAALALALDVTPNRLLLTAEGDDETLVQITPADEPGSARLTWAWACGETPSLLWGEADDERVREFTEENRPHNPPETSQAEIIHWLNEGALDDVEAGYRKARAAEVPKSAIFDYLDLVEARARRRWLEDTLFPPGHPGRGGDLAREGSAGDGEH